MRKMCKHDPNLKKDTNGYILVADAMPGHHFFGFLSFFFRLYETSPSRQRWLDCKRQFVTKKFLFLRIRKLKRTLSLFHYDLVRFSNVDGSNNAEIFKDSIVKLLGLNGHWSRNRREPNDKLRHVLRTTNDHARRLQTR